jgi:hypothetical protein
MHPTRFSLNYLCLHGHQPQDSEMGAMVQLVTHGCKQHLLRAKQVRERKEKEKKNGKKTRKLQLSPARLRCDSRQTLPLPCGCGAESPCSQPAP